MPTKHRENHLPPRKYLNRAEAYPSCLEIQTISVCNARCPVCPHEAVSKEQPSGRMSDELIDRILAECADHASEIDLIVPYFNNEPFADKRMIAILRKIKLIGIPVELSTNGSLLTSNHLRAINDEGLVDVFRLSVFGATQETYERRMRGLKWDTATSTIKRVLAELSRNVKVEIIMVSSPDLTAGEVDVARNAWQRENVTVKLFGYLDRAGNCSDMNLLPANQQTARILGCDLNRPFERMAIRHDGRCVLCSQDWRGQVVLGNALQESIQDIWSNDRYSEIRDQVSGKVQAASQMLCRKCKLAILE